MHCRTHQREKRLVQGLSVGGECPTSAVFLVAGILGSLTADCRSARGGRALVLTHERTHEMQRGQILTDNFDSRHDWDSEERTDDPP